MTTPTPAPAATGALLLIRHAQTDDNAQGRISGWTDSCLSGQGRAQAERLAAHVRRLPPLERLYASPLQRAWLTAAAIGAAVGLAPEPAPGLREIHFGEVEGTAFVDFEQRYPELYARWLDPTAELLWPGGESRAGFRRRIMAALEPIEAESHVRRVAVVSHGGVIATYLASRFGSSAADWFDFRVRNCSITEIGWSDGAPSLLCRDTVDHLGDLIHP